MPISWESHGLLWWGQGPELPVWKMGQRRRGREHCKCLQILPNVSTTISTPDEDDDSLSLRCPFHSSDLLYPSCTHPGLEACAFLSANYELRL